MSGAEQRRRVNVLMMRLDSVRISLRDHMTAGDMELVEELERSVRALNAWADDAEKLAHDLDIAAEQAHAAE